MVAPTRRPSLTKPCDRCDGAGKISVPGYQACNFRRPMSTCDGDCPGCGGHVDCPTCDGDGRVPDRAVVCLPCLDESGELCAAEPGTTTCRACRELAEEDAEAARGVA